jgi:hypothetical protein
MTVVDSQDFLDQGKTGIYEIDLFLRSVNPSKATRKARVFNPDTPRAARISSSETLPQDEDLVIIPGASFTKDFIGMPGPPLDGTVWRARGELQLYPQGASFVYEDSHWTYITGGARLSLSAADTAYDSVTGGTFRLYAVRVDDDQIASLIYTSSVFVTTHVT